MRQAFAATRGPNRALIFGGIGLCLVGALGFSLLAKSAPVALVGTLAGLLALAGFAGIVLGYAQTGATSLELEGDTLFVPKRGPLRLAGAELGPYNAQNGMRLGTALHLRGVDGALVVAALGHRCDPALARARGVGGADYFVEPAVLDAILARTRAASAAAPDVLHVQLTANGLQSFAMLLPFVGGMIVAVVLGTVLERFGLLRSQLGQGVFGAVVFLGIAGAVVHRIVSGSRRTRGPRLELHPHLVRLVPEQGAPLEVPRASLGASAFSWTYTSRTGNLRCPGLALALPGQPPLTIGALSLASPFGGAPDARAPAYLVGEPDLRALAQALRLI